MWHQDTLVNVRNEASLFCGLLTVSITCLTVSAQLMDVNLLYPGIIEQIRNRSPVIKYVGDFVPGISNQ